MFRGSENAFEKFSFVSSDQIGKDESVVNDLF